MTDERPDGARAARLVMSGGPLDGSEYPLPSRPSTSLIGSSVDADIQIMLGNVESVHTTITRNGDEFVLADVGSATGTFLNGERVESEAPLHDGDEICLGSPGMKGSAKLLLRLAPAAPADTGPELDLRAPALVETQATPSLQGFGSPGSFDDDFPQAASFTVPPPAAVAVEEDAIFVEATPASETPEPPPAAFVADPPAPPAPAVVLPPPAVPAPASPAFVPPPPPPARAAVPPPPPPRRAEAPPQPAEPAPQGSAPEPAAFPPPPPPAAARTPASAQESDAPSAPLLPDEGNEFPALRPEPKGRKRSARRRSLFGAVGRLLSPRLLAVLAGLAMLAAAAWFGRGLLESEPPRIATVSPREITPGQTITISGSHFAKDPAANTVLFGPAPGTVTSATRTELRVVVPPGARAQRTVVVHTAGGQSNVLPVTVIVVGEATGIEPEVAAAGQTVLIKGAGLASGSIAVLIGGLEPASLERGVDGVRVVVPETGLPEGTRTTLSVQTAARSQAFDLFIGRTPLLLEVDPNTGRVGDKVVLRGRGFHPEPHGNTVRIGRQPALVLSAKHDELQAFVPAGAAAELPELPVSVTVAGRLSRTPTTFILTRGSGAQYQLRFFPDAVAEMPGADAAFVSTVLGPVFLLGGSAGAGSAAERAEALSRDLNAIVEAAAGQVPAVELRDLSLLVAGRPRPLLTVTQDDVAAYSRPWDGRPQKVSAGALARHWSALLQDYLGLFLGRERPVQMLELSPRGRVLSEIHGEAARRAPGERTVPAAVVENAAGGLAQPLRQLALVVSTEAPRAAAAIEGRWQGTIEDPDAGGRAISAHITSQAGALSGTLTVWAGSIEVRSPLRELSFERGVLRFTATLQGTAYRFRGNVESSKLKGSIERQGRPPLAFSMDYQD